jgi:hypothetical protein
MSRKERRSPRTELIRARLDSGDHAAVRAVARGVLADRDASDEERAAAAAALASLSPEPAAVVAGAIGAVVSVVITVLVLLQG